MGPRLTSLRSLEGRMRRGTSLVAGSKSTLDGLPVEAGKVLASLEQTPLDLIRLPIYWQMIEPEAGRYDDLYIERVAHIVEQARGSGFDVIIDLHQDGFGEGFGLRGAPAWAGSTAVGPRSVGPWWLTYLRRDVADAFDSLYRGPLRQRYTAMLKVLACGLRGVAPLGYELLNEPHWAREGLGVEARTLPEFYAHAMEAIRSHDDDALIGLAPAPFANLGMRTQLAPGVNRGDSRCFYAPHLYFAAQELGLPPPRDFAVRVDARISQLVDDAKRLALPLLVTEFGIRSDVPGAGRFISATLDALDRQRVSACHWESGPNSAYGLVSHPHQIQRADRGMCRPFVAQIDQGSVRSTATGLELALDPGGTALVRHPLGEAPALFGEEVRCELGGPRELHVAAPAEQSARTRIDFASLA